MNYLTEIRAFYDWLITNPIPSDAQALWHALMHINNKCAWKEEFTVANTTLLSILGFSRQQLDRMRNVLIQTGRIEYKKRNGRKAGIYRIIPFVPNNVTQPVTQVETQPVTQPVTQTGHNCSTLNKLNKTKQNNNNNHDNNARENFSVFAAFEQEFGRPLSPMERQQVIEWSNEFTDELLVEALRRAILAGRPTMAYIRGILTDWLKNNVRTLLDAEERDRYFRQRQAERSKGKNKEPPDEKKRFFDALLMS